MVLGGMADGVSPAVVQCIFVLPKKSLYIIKNKYQ
jgi:hypothetical protein